MKDRYLFKAKRIDNGEWVEGYLCRKYYQELPHDRLVIQYKTMGNEYEWTPKYMTAEIDENTICQYTGLTDKNGNKIWENDIVQYCDFTTENYVIGWDSDKARYEYRQYCCSMMDFDETSSIEVEAIGNIFDHPGVLEGQV